MEELQDQRPDYSDDLGQAVEDAYKDVNGIYFQLYNGQGAVRMNDFAESGQDEESDRHAHVHVEKYMEEMRLYYAERDDLWIGMALGATEGVRKDLTNDRLESAVAVNIVTKEEIFRRFGDDDETPLQEENREMIKDPHNTALVHNHWNDSPGSQADFDAALWLGVRYLIVVTPSGKQYIYERDGDTMKLLDEIFNREHVALPSPAETEESREAYEAQLLAEAGNPAERVMRQGEPDSWFEFEFQEGELIRLDVPEGLSVEGAQALATQLWESMSVIERQLGYGGALARDWAALWVDDTAKQRERAYELISEALEESDGIRGDIRFYRAAQNVSFLFSLGDEYIVHRRFNQYAVSSSSAETFHSAMDILDRIGEELMEFNMGIIFEHFEAASAGDNVLISPLAYGDGAISPSIEVHSALEWDIHMVWREQAELGAIIDRYEKTKGGDLSGELGVVNEIMTLKNIGFPFYQFADFADNTASDPVKWVIDELGGPDNLDFEEVQHRRAIGIAMVFQEHFEEAEEAKERFKAFFETMPEDPNELPPQL